MTVCFPHRLAQSVALFLTLTVLAPAPAIAASSASSDPLTLCIQQSFKSLAKQERLYRVTLLGRNDAATVAQGTVWYDDQTGDAWIKDDDDTWHTIPTTTPTRSDSDMNAAVEKDPNWNDPLRRGILSTRTTLTSTILPPLTQAFRALQCRLETVCRLTTGATVSAEDSATATVDGCLPPSDLGLQSITQCNFTGETAARDSIEASDYCRQAADGILAHEAEALKLLVAYDAATRTILQYAGIFGSLVEFFRLPVLRPLIDLMNLVSDLTRAPCFLSACAP